MKYHIDTIPVWDAYKNAESECPICDLKKHNEELLLQSFLGASVMEPTTRVTVNDKYFCAAHLARMASMKNRLGLGLMTHSHLKERQKALDKAKPSGGGLLRRAETAPVAITTCVLCERLEDTVNRYLYTTLHLYKTDPAFQKVFEASRGLCLPHYDAILRMAGPGAFADALYALEKANLARIEEQLAWFTKKFDHANADKPWGESKDSLERAINKLRGFCV